MTERIAPERKCAWLYVGMMTETLGMRRLVGERSATQAQRVIDFQIEVRGEAKPGCFELVDGVPKRLRGFSSSRFRTLNLRPKTEDGFRSLLNPDSHFVNGHRTFAAEVEQTIAERRQRHS